MVSMERFHMARSVFLNLLFSSIQESYFASLVHLAFEIDKRNFQAFLSSEGITPPVDSKDPASLQDRITRSRVWLQYGFSLIHARMYHRVVFPRVSPAEMQEDNPAWQANRCHDGCVLWRVLRLCTIPRRARQTLAVNWRMKSP